MPPPAPPADAAPPCAVAAGARFQGLLAFRGAARLDGQLEGRVFARGTLLVGESGELRANVEVDELVVAGRVEGCIRARERVELLPGARVAGRIVTRRLCLAEGARFDGELAMRGLPEGG